MSGLIFFFSFGQHRLTCSHVLFHEQSAISDKREIIFLHDLLLHVRDTLMEWQSGMNSSIWKPSDILLAVVEHECKTSAITKAQNIRMKALMESKTLLDNAIKKDDYILNNRNSQISKIENPRPSITSISDPADVAELKRKVAQLTREKEVYKKRAKSEVYQISCRGCESSKFV